MLRERLCQAESFWRSLSQITRRIVLAAMLLIPILGVLGWERLWHAPSIPAQEIGRDAARLWEMERHLSSLGILFRRDVGLGRSTRYRVDHKGVERFFQANPSKTAYDLIFALERFASFSDSFLRKYGKPFRAETSAGAAYTELVGAEAIRAKMEAARTQGRSYREWIQIF